MAFLRKLFQGGSKGKKKDYPNIIRGTDPLEQWRKIGELGDGAFGKVYKVVAQEFYGASHFASLFNGLCKLLINQKSKYDL